MSGLDLTYKIEHKLQLLIKGRLTSLLLRMGFPKVLYLDHYYFFCTSVIYTPAQTNLTFIYGSSYCVIVRVSVILKRTVVGDWRLDNLNGSHFQSQVNNSCQSMMF